MNLQRGVGGTGWTDVFEWTHSGSNTSFRNLVVQNGEPTLTFDDTGGSTQDMRIRVDAGVMYFEDNYTGSWAANLQIDRDYAYANNGMCSGTTSSNHALQWQVFTGALGNNTPCVIDATLGTERRIVGAIAMITPATGDDVDATYRVYDYRHTESQSARFYVDVERGTAAGKDEVMICFDPANYGSTARFKVVAFYSPVIRTAGEPMAHWRPAAALALASCRPAILHLPLGADGDGETGGGPTGDGWRPSVYDWLPNTKWNCDWVFTRQGTIYRVAHTWEFTEAELSTDCGQQLSMALSRGEISSDVAFHAGNWIEQDGTTLFDARSHHWLGMGANVILADFCACTDSGSTLCIGYEHVLHRDGERHMAIQTPVDSYIASAISCTLED